MPTIKIVRYATAPEHADTNELLVRDVFAELASTRPDGLRYATLRLDDRSASSTSPSSTATTTRSTPPSPSPPSKDDNHAEEIVHLVREIFDKGNDFCAKITYRA